MKDKKELIFSGTLAILDGHVDNQGECFSSGCNVDFAEKVKVTHEFKEGSENCLGDALLYRDEDKIKYTITINNDKLSLECLKELTPAIAGKILKKEGCMLNHISIESVGLTLNPSDTRLKKLGE